MVIDQPLFSVTLGHLFLFIPVLLFPRSGNRSKLGQAAAASVTAHPRGSDPVLTSFLALPNSLLLRDFISTAQVSCSWSLETLDLTAEMDD